MRILDDFSADFSYMFLVLLKTLSPCGGCFCCSCSCHSFCSKGSLKSNHSPQQIPMAVKDGKASKLRSKTL